MYFRRRVMVEEPYLERRYRGLVEPQGLTCYRVSLAESDLYICTAKDLREESASSLARHRGELECYLSENSWFGESFRPVPTAAGAPGIVREMADAAERFGVGPMAAVAGAVADFVGRDLLALSEQVIVENGGDIFSAGGRSRRVRVFAGAAQRPVEILVTDTPDGTGLCTSSGTVGPSASMGRADAVTVLAPTACLADAAATAIGNMVGSEKDIDRALAYAARREEVLGIVVLAGGAMGALGSIEIALPPVPG